MVPKLKLLFTARGLSVQPSLKNIATLGPIRSTEIRPIMLSPFSVKRYFKRTTSKKSRTQKVNNLTFSSFFSSTLRLDRLAALMVSVPLNDCQSRLSNRPISLK